MIVHIKVFFTFFPLILRPSSMTSLLLFPFCGASYTVGVSCLEVCPVKRDSRAPQVTPWGPAPVIMRCWGFSTYSHGTCIHMCGACHCCHSTPAPSVILCSPGRIWWFNCSRCWRNVLLFCTVPVLYTHRWQVWRHVVDEEADSVTAV